MIEGESGTPREQLFSRSPIVSNTETVHPFLLDQSPQNTMHRSPIKVRLMLFDFQPNRQLFLQLRKTMSMAAERMSKRRQKNNEDKRKIDEKELLDPVSFLIHTNQGSRKLFSPRRINADCEPVAQKFNTSSRKTSNMVVRGIFASEIHVENLNSRYF